MINAGKVVRQLELQLDDLQKYAADGELLTLTQEQAKEIIALLKEQEPIAPSVCGSKEPDGHGCWWYLCGKCKKPIDHKDRFCKRCGQAVKWDEVI